MRKLTATTERGVFTRTTGRIYTHVVLQKNHDWQVAQGAREWHATWVGRADLVAGAVRAAQRAGYLTTEVYAVDA